jgi:hypothetical protein
MRGSVAYRVGGIVLVLLLTGLAIFLVRPREFLLTYCSVGLFLASLLGTAWFRRPGLRNAFLAVASIGLITGLLDPITYLAGRPPVQAEGTWNNEYHYLWDANLGIALPPSVVATSRKFTDTGLVYDVTYTTDAHGHRKTVGSTDPTADSVVFMGCSFTFGEGVEDNETLPQQFSDETVRKYNVVNVGVSTFGVHQPLRSMELGQLDDILTGGKRFFVYSGIPGHAQRAAARGLRGPAYRLRADGSVKYLGQTQSFWEVFAVAIANRSLFLRTFVVIPMVSGFSADAVPLYVALVKRAGQVARERYRAKFIVIFWDDPGDQLGAEIMAAFDEAKISYVRVSSMLPDFQQDDRKYRLSGDGHPNAQADHLIGQYLARHLDDIPPQP